MRVHDWNTFLSSHPTATLLGAVVSTRLPPALRTDKNGGKLPTPYKLFCEWLDGKLRGSWSAISLPQGFVIGVVDESDKLAILAAYGPARHKGLRLAQRSVAVLNYDDGSYVELAEACGYSLRF